MMKITFKISFLLLAFILSACAKKESNHQSVETSLQRSATEHPFEKNITNLEDHLEITYRDALDEIEASLNSIAQMRGIVNRSTLEPGMDEHSKKEKIIEGIQIINSLLIESEKSINQLKLQVRKGKAESETLNRIISQLERKLENETEKVMALKMELSQRDFEIADLTARIDELENEKANLMANYRKLYKESRTVYIAMGTFKELKQKGIIDKEGGILNVGSVASLSKDFPDEYFRKLNMDDSTLIAINGKKISLVTAHSSGSYEIKTVNNKSYLHITNPREFWKTSRYLVVQY